MPRDAEIVRNKPPLIDDFAVQRADGADLAMRFYQMVAVRGSMPGGGTNRVEIAVCSIPALLAMKGHAVNARYKQKDAYDIYYCIRNYPTGIAALAEACRPLLEHPSGAEGYGFINEKFDAPDGYGPSCVRNFVEATRLLGEVRCAVEGDRAQVFVGVFELGEFEAIEANLETEQFALIVPALVRFENLVGFLELRQPVLEMRNPVTEW